MIKGMDVSKWNGKGNWDKAKANGVEFAFIRLGSIDDTTGICYLDYLLQDHLSEALRTNTPFGYYFYTRPKYPVEVQSNFILENLSKLPKAQLEFAVDSEVSGLSVISTTEFTMGLHIALIAEQYLTMCYSRQSFWDANISADPFWSTLKLWAARYNTMLTGPWSDGRYVFRDWKDWKFWQFTSNGDAVAYGFPGDPYALGIDLDWYNGTLEDFRAEYDVLTPMEKLEQRVNVLEKALSDLSQKQDSNYKSILDLDYKIARLVEWAKSYDQT